MKQIKRMLTILLVAAMVLGQVPAIAFAVENTTEFMGGRGIADDPYLISNKAHLNNVRNYPQAQFLLVTDIVFTEEDFQENGEFYNDGLGWTPIGDAKTPFAGVFDGNGRAIKGLQCAYTADATLPSTMQLGLFGENSGVIRNLTLQSGKTEYYYRNNRDCYWYVGGIAGKNSGQIINCVNKNPVKITNLVEGSTVYVGGIAGYNTGNIQNCINQAQLYGQADVSSVGEREIAYTGGIAGYSAGIVSGCGNFADFTAIGSMRDHDGYFAAGIVGYQQAGQIRDCYNAGKFINDRVLSSWSYTGYAGGIAAYNADGAIQNVYNVGSVLQNTTHYYGYGSENIHYGGAICGSNSGTVTNAYYLDIASTGIGTGVGSATKCTVSQIKQQETFQGFDFETVWQMGADGYPMPVLQDNPAQMGALQENITEFAGGTGSDWDPFRIATKEHLDHIRNYPNATYVLENDIAGEGLETIEEFLGNFDGKGFAISGLTAALFGKTSGTIQHLTLRDCRITAPITPRLDDTKPSERYYFGFVTRTNTGVIRNCTISGGLTVTVNLEKVNKQDAEDGYSGRDMYTYSYTYAGGVAARNWGIMEGCKSSVAMKFTGNSYIESVVPSSYVGSQVLSARIEGHMGGIVAENDGIIRNSSFDGTTDFGIDAYLIGSRSKCKTYNYDYFGGIAANNDGLISGCANKGTLTADAQLTGANKVGYGYVYMYGGGIAGNNAGTVENSYHAGDLSLSIYNNSTDNEYSAVVGGITKDGKVNNCYSTDVIELSLQGKASTQSGVGGSSGSGKVGLDNFTLEQMQTPAPYTQYDFENIWCFDTSDGYLYPQLRWQIPEIVEISISAKPSKPIETVQGVFPDLSEVTLQIRYNDGSVKTVAVIPGMLVGFDVDQVGTQVLHLANGGVISTDTLTVVVREPAPVSISISKQPTTLEYYIGTAAPDLTGGEIEILYDNGTTERTPMTADMISGFDGSVVGTQTLTVTYGGKTAAFDILVYKVAEISVATNPSKLSYVQGQPLNVSGGKLTVAFTNGTSKTVAMTMDMVTYADDLTGTVWVTVTYEEIQTGFEITVNPRQIQSIRMTEPRKLSYITGEELDLSGGYFRVTFVSEDGYFEDVPMEPAMVSGYDKQTPGFQTLTATYKSYSATFVVRVVEKTIASLEMFALPEKLVFRGGLDGLDTVGGQLRVNYEDGTEAVIDILPEMVANFDNTVAGKQTLTVTYKTHTVSYEVEIIKATVEFRNADGTVLSSTQYLWGEPVAAPADPTKPADKTYTYTFAGWDREVTNCAGDTVYTATYDAIYIDYTITFQYADGTPISVGKYHYGEAVLLPEDPAALEEGCPFIGWDKEVVVCQGDAVYTAVFKKPYTPGDLTGEGEIDSLDGLMILQYLNGWDIIVPVAEAMDVNADGKVDSLDGLLLMRYLNNWEITLG